MLIITSKFIAACELTWKGFSKKRNALYQAASCPQYFIILSFLEYLGKICLIYVYNKIYKHYNNH